MKYKNQSCKALALESARLRQKAFSIAATVLDACQVVIFSTTLKRPFSHQP